MVRRQLYAGNDPADLAACALGGIPTLIDQCSRGRLYIRVHDQVTIFVTRDGAIHTTPDGMRSARRMALLMMWPPFSRRTRLTSWIFPYTPITAASVATTPRCAVGTSARTTSTTDMNTANENWTRHY